MQITKLISETVDPFRYCHRDSPSQGYWQINETEINQLPVVGRMNRQKWG